MDVRVINDPEEVYVNGSIISLEELKRDYEEANWTDKYDDLEIAWDGWTEQEILRFICDAWSLTCEFVEQ